MRGHEEKSPMIDLRTVTHHHAVVHLQTHTEILRLLGKLTVLGLILTWCFMLILRWVNSARSSSKNATAWESYPTIPTTARL